MVRWLGRRRVEQYIKRLFRVVKEEDPEGLVTYVNYPSTEYLQLPFLDLVAFNVYLESPDQFEAYLARLQNITGERPLVMSELGLDGLRHGEQAQAEALDWQVRGAFRAGCAGAFIFAWTDEWFRAGEEVDDWAFGLTDRLRRPKPALTAVGAAFEDIPLPAGLPWPRISVVLCSYNGARTIRDCLVGLQKLEYPDFEVLVVDDGSTDGTAGIACEYGARVITTPNHGLSAARNTGLQEATGEIIAYIDDDAYPDPHWLTYLAATFLSTRHAAVGGPNIAPPGDGPIAECVANAPGGPAHVLVSDSVAEHVPGCNMAVRASCLRAIGGFDPRFRVAGDDVDVCWRLQQQGWTVGFSPAAIVWHHRRNSVRTYWKQQYGYGRAEALLEQKWPEKYNSLGHLAWTGRVYGRTRTVSSWGSRIYHGTWGSAPFQSLYQPAAGVLPSLPGMPEWYLVMLIFAGLSVLGAVWAPLLLAVPVLMLASGMSVAHAVRSAMAASFPSRPCSRLTRLKLRTLTALLHLVQPLARLCGRVRHGLSPWRRRGISDFSVPRPRTFSVWNDRWRDPADWLRMVELALRAEGLAIRCGGDYDNWDLEVRSGLFGVARALMAIEDHGAGTQFVRARTWPRWSPTGLALAILVAALSFGAAVDGAWFASAILGFSTVLLAVRMLQDCAAVTAAIRRPFQHWSDDALRQAIHEPGPSALPIQPSQTGAG
jgi:GT2 family glycosyltransferase